MEKREATGCAAVMTERLHLRLSVRQHVVRHTADTCVSKRFITYTHSQFVITVKIEVKVIVKFTLEQATKAHRRSRGIAILFL